MRKITPFLWFDTQAKEAAEFYVSIFKNSKILSSSPMSVAFVLDGQELIGLNGGPSFKFNEAISLFVNCDTQEEVDDLWENLSSGGSKGNCGWLKDKYGMSWQVIPRQLGEYVGDPDPVKSKRVVDAMLKMTKIDIKELEKAYEGR